MSPGPRPPEETFGRERWTLGAYLFIASAASLAIVGLVALLLHQPWVFPSLGPTAFMLFAAPLAVASSPRSVVAGHAIAIIAGVVALLAFGLYGADPDLADVSWQRVCAAALAVGLTLAAMTWLGVAHAPAAATTLIVALGMLQTPQDLIVMLLAVVALIATSLAINRIHGVRVPVLPGRATSRPRPEPGAPQHEPGPGSTTGQ